MGAVLQPQELEVFYLLPAIRREMALCLKKSGKKQKEIAQILAVRESTISQYLKDKRAAGFPLPADVKSQIEAAVGRINDKMTLIHETQRVLAALKEQRFPCSVHLQLDKDLPRTCEVCYVQ